MLSLTKEELQQLAGTKKRDKLKKWLLDLGVNFLTDVHGYPKVSREIISKKLNGEIELTPVNNKKGNEDALRKAMGLK
jgi:hypothetical protein